MKEQSLEQSITQHLLANGYRRGGEYGYKSLRSGSETNIPRLDANVFIDFLRDSQPESWDSLTQMYGSDTATSSAVVSHLNDAFNDKRRGVVHTLRNGFTLKDITLHPAYFLPDNPSGEEKALYGKNRLTLSDNTKQVDIVLMVNGIPIATVETKSTLPDHKVELYEHLLYSNVKSAPRKQLALVHFLLSPDEAYMATTIEGKQTKFLPFNKGNNGGAGNPEHPSGFKTAYMWEQIWLPNSLLEIVQHFIHQEKDGRLLFPRYHQLDSVRLLLATTSRKTLKNYLIQHSAGSGKTNTIGWLAHRLISLHNPDGHRVYDTVLVLSDRTVLNTQLQEKVDSFRQAGTQSVISINEGSKELATALEQGNRVVVTTLQMYPHAIKKISELPERQYAIIADEAHSSQLGKTSLKMKRFFGDFKEFDDDIANILSSARLNYEQENITYYAFTATPTDKTLQAFGVGSERSPVPFPFHVYSMKQAIDEGYILDVLKNYTAYLDYSVNKGLPELVKDKEKRIKQIAGVIVDHVAKEVVHQLGGHAKAMVVTTSRASAVRYKIAIDDYIRRAGYSIKALVAFSQTITVDGEKYTEKAMNGNLPFENLPKTFGEVDEYRILIVADKYQTGFDQPLLTTMYVDKKLRRLKAVQTLSRLNRTHSGHRDKGTYVLDFVNDKKNILKAFAPFMDTTGLVQITNDEKLIKLRQQLDEYHVYSYEEVRSFANIELAIQQMRIGERSMTEINSGVESFMRLRGRDRDEFRLTLKSYLTLYSVVAQVVLLEDTYMEALNLFGEVLYKNLPKETDEDDNVERGISNELIASLTCRQAMVLAYLLRQQDGIYRRPDIVVSTGFPDITIRTSIERLFELGFITKPRKYRQGKFQGAQYHIANQPLCDRFVQILPEIECIISTKSERLTKLGEFYPSLLCLADSH